MVINLHESNAQALCGMLPEGWIPSVLTIDLMQNYIVDPCARIKVVARSSNACYVSTNCCFFPCFHCVYWCGWRRAPLFPDNGPSVSERWSRADAPLSGSPWTAQMFILNISAPPLIASSRLPPSINRSLHRRDQAHKNIYHIHW